MRSRPAETASAELARFADDLRACLDLDPIHHPGGASERSDEVRRFWIDTHPDPETKPPRYHD